ncbi:MAG: hypothetical protein ACKPKO_34860, partial [Candidatus Fonsibacter sp.]
EAFYFMSKSEAMSHEALHRILFLWFCVRSPLPSGFIKSGDRSGRLPKALTSSPNMAIRMMMYNAGNIHV